MRSRPPRCARRAPALVNVAGDGVITVSQAARLAGRPTVPVPMQASGWVGQVVRRSRLADFSPEQMQQLAYGRGLDTRRMREVLGFEPALHHARRRSRPSWTPGAARAPPLVPRLVDATRAAAQGWIGASRLSTGG